MNKKIICIAALLTLGSLVGCADQKTQKQAAAEQWGRTRATVLLSLANDQYRSGNLDKCAETVNQAIAVDPTNAELHLLKARLLIEQGQLESALRDLDLARQFKPDHPEIDYLTGVIHQRWQRPQQALDAYSAAARKKPDDIAYLMAQSEMLVSMDRQADARQLLLARVTYFEHSAAIRDAIAQLCEQMGDLQEAVEYYRQASVLDSSDECIRERLAWALYRTGDYRDAHSQFLRVCRSEANSRRIDLLLATAECELKLAMHAEARKHFDEVTNIDATLPSGWLGVARTSIELNDIRRADAAASRAVMLQPKSAQTQMTLGYVRMRQGRVDDAIVAFKRASAADPSDSLALCMVGLALKQKGEVGEARRWYERAAEVSPDDELPQKLIASAF